MAIQAGKDVQCEKPTLTINEGKLLIKAVRKHKKVFQTSTEDRSVPEYHRMAELVRNGRIGKLQRIEVILPQQPQVPGDPTPQPVPKELDYDMWLGPAPYAPYTQRPRPFQFPLDSGLLGRNHHAIGARTSSTPRNGPTTPSAAGRWKSKARAHSGRAGFTTPSRITT